MGKGFKKIAEGAPQLTEELKREVSAKLLNPFPVPLSPLLIQQPSTPKRLILIGLTLCAFKIHMTIVSNVFIRLNPKNTSIKTEN